MKVYALYYRNCAIIMAILCVLQNQAKGNGAQPGIWNAGGTVFTMLYPEDTLSFKKIRMQKKQIFIQLYQVYAVIKGSYLFKNTTKEQLDFKMGYPVNGIYHGGSSQLNEVYLDSLSQFKIKCKNHWLPLNKQPNTDYGAIQSFSDNWMVWSMAFAPQEMQTVEVYFIVNTNNGQVRKGYDLNKQQALIYLIESASMWKQPIEQAYFYIQLMDGLQQVDIKGLSTGFNFRYNEDQKLYFGTKTNFIATAKDNLIVTYAEQRKPFDFQQIRTTSEFLFDEIDHFSQMSLQDLEYKTIEVKDPYKVNRSILGFVPGLLILFIIYFPIIIGIIFLFVAVWACIKWKRIKNKSKSSL